MKKGFVMPFFYKNGFSLILIVFFVCNVALMGKVLNKRDSGFSEIAN
jgi:hypothetical protein